MGKKFLISACILVALLAGAIWHGVQAVQEYNVAQQYAAEIKWFGEGNMTSWSMTIEEFRIVGEFIDRWASAVSRNMSEMLLSSLRGFLMIFVAALVVVLMTRWQPKKMS
jgi:hypothetical protein